MANLHFGQGFVQSLKKVKVNYSVTRFVTFFKLSSVVFFAENALDASFYVLRAGHCLKK